MSVFFLILPDFLLIALGAGLLRWSGLSKAFFQGLESLVYFVLFPALLFRALTETNISISQAYLLFTAAASLCVVGVALSWLALPVLKPNPLSHASLVQTAYRFNTYLGLSLATSLGGSAQTTMAVIVGFSVPLVNIAAVHALARQQSGLLKQIVKNPLILATTAGLVCNLGNIPIPTPIETSISRLGAGALGLGLLCVGTSLSRSGMQESPSLTAWMATVRLLIMPLAGAIIALLLPLTALERHVILIFAALPTATSAHVLAAQMGGRPQIVAVTMTITTLLSAITLPAWLTIANAIF